MNTQSASHPILVVAPVPTPVPAPVSCSTVEWSRRRWLRSAALAATGGALAAFAGAKPALSQPGVAVSPLRYLGQQVLERDLRFESIPVGGLSGIDHDGRGTFFAISDDRSVLGPARFYTLGLDLTRFQRSSSPGMDGIRLTGMHRLRTALGAQYTLRSVDPEGIRFDPKTRRLLWIDEGQRTAGRVLRPALREMTLSGDWTREFALPAPFLPAGTSAGTHPADSGPRDNLSLESIGLDLPRRRVWIATENALLQDGPRASATEGTPVRVQSFDLDSGAAGPAWVYPVEPVVMPPLIPGTPATNGLTELLVLDNGDFLMLERSFTPLFGATIRLYAASAAGATDVSALPALNGVPYTPMRKRLLLDLASLVHDDGTPLVPDNMEAMCWGPLSPNGLPTLILVSDDNFSANQITQFIALEVTGSLLFDRGMPAMS
jgi:hypothetical protein